MFSRVKLTLVYNKYNNYISDRSRTLGLPKIRTVIANWYGGSSINSSLRITRTSLSEPEGRDHLAADLVVEVARPLAVASGAGDHHQRQEVLLARMTGACGRRLVPLGEPRLALRTRRFRRLVEPGVEGGGGRRVAIAEMAEDIEKYSAVP